MKKIMIAITAVVIAAASQAATVRGTMSQVQASDGSGAASGYLAMVFDAATAQSDVIAAVMAKDSSTLATLANDWNQTTTSNTSGLLSSAGNGSYAASETFSVYLVVFDAGSVADANNYFVSETKSGSINAAGSNATLAFGTFASQVAATGSSGGWVAVPEPTSGLLLLLGMAGLALKRKRA